MKAAGTCAALAIALAGGGAAAQGGGDTVDRLRACSVLAQAERAECLEKLARDINPAPPSPTTPPDVKTAPAADDWTVSETTSPFDYTPVAIATASSSGGADGAAMQLSIQCRGGRTELVIGSPALDRRSDDYAVAYAINDSPPVALTAGPPTSGKGIAIKGDVARLLAALPDRGDLSLRVETRQAGIALQGRYSLSALRNVRDRLAVPCGWPASSMPRN